MRRLRKTGARDPTTGEVVVIPRLPPITGASKPPGWNRWSAAEKAEHLLSMSLDRIMRRAICVREFVEMAGIVRELHPASRRINQVAVAIEEFHFGTSP